MKSKRLGIVVVSAVTGAILLTACNDDDVAVGTDRSPSAKGNSSSDAGHSAGGDTADGAEQWGDNKSDATFFWSALNGTEEVPVKGGPAVGDKEGHSLALMRIQGDQVSYAFTFNHLGTPTLGHLHKGVRGVNGDVKIPFFTETLKDGEKFAHGTVTVDDADLLKGIKENPQNWYFNVHTGEFPGGAVRGQASELPTSVHVPDRMTEDNLNSVMKNFK